MSVRRLNACWGLVALLAGPAFGAEFHVVPSGIPDESSVLTAVDDDQSKSDHQAEAESPKFSGVWVGKLSVGATTLKLVMELKEEKPGVWSGVMDSPDQFAFDIPLSNVTVQESKIQVEVKKIGGEFSGEFRSGGSELAGQWKQGGRSTKLILKRGEKVLSPKRPQEPKPPFSYQAEEVVYENASAKVKLAGTLTLPTRDKPYPAVLLISGSGPQDRNEELMGHKPFLVLADFLTRHGVAVLRVDDRGVGKSTGEFGQATTRDFAEDALAGVAYLKSRPDIDGRRIGLIGHSEGGLIAPLAASKSTDVAFIVLLAGPGVNGEEIIYRQADLIAAAAGAPSFARVINRELQKKLFAIVKDSNDTAKAEQELNTIMRLATLDVLSLFRVKDKSDPSDPVAAQVKSLVSPWFRQFLTYDPKPTLERVQCPVLALNGERDLQVCPKQNLPVIEAALRSGGNSDFTVRELPMLNHLFQECKTGSPTEYGQIEETMNTAALDAIWEWMSTRIDHNPRK